MVSFKKIPPTFSGWRAIFISLRKGSGDNASGLPKAIKAEGDIVINSGSVTCVTSQNGGEGIESKSTVTINGGTVVCNTCDDGINASKTITPRTR